MRKVLVMVACLALLSVPAMAAKVKVWKVPSDFSTIQDAIDSPDVADGDVIRVGPTGDFAGAYIDKAVTIEGIGTANIDSGPAHSSGLVQGFRFLAGSDGAVLRNLKFDGPDLAIMNGGAVDDVTVDHCTFMSTIQGVSNWRGSGWAITYNTFTDLRSRNGGGIAILLGDYAGGTVSNNLVDHNTITGTLYVYEDDGGGYNGTGIVLYADFRWGGAGAAALTDNLITHNKVSLGSDTPDVVDVVAVELTDTRDDESLDPVIYDNAVGFNDLRGTTLQLDLTPDTLEDVNTISRNLGNNRGHGVHPSVFQN